MDDGQTAAVAKALAHPARLHILRLLATQTDCRGADVFAELPLAQSTISEHLRVLKLAGLIVSRAEGSGNAMVYCIDAEPLTEFLAEISALASSPTLCHADGRDC